MQELQVTWTLILTQLQSTSLAPAGKESHKR